MDYVKGLHGVIRVYSGLSWAEFLLNGTIVSQNPPSGLYPGLTEDEIAEAKKVISTLSLAPYENAYLRFNDLPADRKSRNHATGKAEQGVSCYTLTWDLVNGCYKRCGAGLDGAMIAYHAQEAPIYFIAGEECGTGSDGESLLANVKILSKAKFDKNKGGYVID